MVKRSPPTHNLVLHNVNCSIRCRLGSYVKFSRTYYRNIYCHFQIASSPLVILITRLNRCLSSHCTFLTLTQDHLSSHLGPPRGPCSHITMFRLGSVLFVLSYSVVIFFREPLAGPKSHGSLVLMIGMGFLCHVKLFGLTRPFVV